MASTANIFSKNYERARVFQQKLENEFKLNSNDCYNFGLIYMHLKQEENKKYYLNKSLELNPDNPYTLNAIGYELTREHRYDEALEFLEKTIRIQPDFAYAYNNRGHAKIELGQVEEGLIDIEESMRLDNTNSYVFRNLGIYHLTRNEKEEAMKYLLQSREMDKDTDLIEELILRAS
jgi:tetratricopeptide (TPR) repeat protein